MFGKLVMVVLTIGVCACTLLSLRQARLQAAHELARAQLRVRECDDQLWALRAKIADRVRPEQVQQMAAALGSFRPMLPLPGDLEKRTAYASAAGPQPEPELIAPVKTQPAGASIRPVSNTHREPPAREERAAARPTAKPQPAAAGPGGAKPAAKPPAAKPANKPKPDLKPDPKPDTKARPNADRKTRSDSRQANAKRTERDQ